MSARSKCRCFDGFDGVLSCMRSSAAAAAAAYDATKRLGPRQMRAQSVSEKVKSPDTHRIVWQKYWQNAVCSTKTSDTQLSGDLSRPNVGAIGPTTERFTFNC